MPSLAKFDPGFSNLAVLFDLDLLISRAISFYKQGNKKKFWSVRSEKKLHFKTIKIF